MYYPEEIIEEVRLKNRIEDVISGYVHMQKKGSNLFGLCPFHSEKSASFSVSIPKQMYYCFGCGAGGNVFTFLMEYENFSFDEAVKYLADRAGVTIPETINTPERKKADTLRAQVLEVVKAAATFYYFKLYSPEGKIGRTYLEDRELSEETIKNFGLGYAPKDSSTLVKHLREKGFSDTLIKEAGLVNHSEKYGFSDKMWNRVIFPIQDSNHRVIGFGGRVMGTGEPKYLNSPETVVFDKGRNLYGLNFARTSRTKNMILCEGYMDVIAMHQAGFTQAVASLGTAFTIGQASLLYRYTQEVLLVYDSDHAGVNATLRALPILKEAGLSVKVVDISPNKDPDEFIKKQGKEAFEQRLKNAENSFFYEIRILEKSFDMQDPESKTNFQKEIAKKLCNFTEETERENYLEAVSKRFEIGFSSLRKLVNSVATQTGFSREANRPKSGLQPKASSEEAVLKAQRILLTFICDEPKIFKKIEKYLAVEDFTTPLYKRVAEKVFEGIREDAFEPARVISMFEDSQEQKEVSALFNTEVGNISTKEEKEKAIHDILVKVKQNSYSYFYQQMGNDVSALQKAIEGKKILEALAKEQIHI